MSNIQDLYQQLIELPRRQYSELIRHVDRERRQAAEREERARPPVGDRNRTEFAHWVDFAPDIEGIHFRLFVADVTPGQFEGIQANHVMLPAGWTFEGAEELPPGDR